MEQILKRIEKYILYAIIVLFPIAVLSVSTNPFLPIKLYILTFGIALVLLVKSIRVVVTGNLEVFTGKYDFPVLLVAAAYLISAVTQTPNIMEALLIPGTATIIVSGALLYFLINQVGQDDKETVTSLLLVSGGLYALISILAFLKVFSKIPQLPVFMRVETFNPEGGFLPTAIILSTLLPLAIGVFIKASNATKKFLYAAIGFLMFIAVAISVFNLLPGQPYALRFPNWSTSWSIAVDSLKESPILGVGPGNYITAFNRFRPLAFNQTELWAVKFQTANNFYLTLLTEAGMLALAGMVLLLVSVYRTVRTDLKEKKLVGWGFAGNAGLVSLVLLLIFALFFPIATVSTVLLFILLALNTQTNRTSVNLSTQAVEEEASVGSKFPAFLVTLPIIAAVVAFGYYGVRVVRAEAKFNSAARALSQNQGTQAYTDLQNAITLNPQVDRYRLSYARVNLALANAITRNEELTQQDRNNIAQLVQQAIREGKTAVVLNQFRAGNWETLARIYQSIAPLADGANTFAAQTISQAIALDPFNPNLRITLGGIYYSQGNYETAARVFEQAVAAKNDLANAHYNLALALGQSGNFDEAIQEMTLVLSLVDRDSNDYQTAVQALESLQEQQRAEAGQSDNLTPPQEGEEPILQPPLELPEESEPPESPVSPTPTPAEGEEEAQEDNETTPSPTPAE